MADLIERQAAIDEIARWIGYLDEDMICRIQIGLKRLPSAQPEVLACGSGELVQESGDLVQDLVKDCISRQQAIDALDKHIDTFDAIDTNYLCGLRTAMSILKEMPSAQPETHEERTETHECDLISREQVIDQLHQSYNLLDAEQRLEDLPSAQPQRKTGKWIYHSNWEADGECGYECSECGMGSDVDYNYCMRCGARMVKEGEEHD